METLDFSQKRELRLGGMVVESGRLETDKVVEQLKRISELKVDDLIKVSADKFEKTVEDMFAVIKNLEGHLRTTLELNKTFKSESQQSAKEKELSERLQREAEKKLARLEAQAPLVADLERRLEMTVEEVDKIRGQYKLEMEKTDKLNEEIRMLRTLHERCQQERDDAYKELVIIQNQIELARQAKEGLAVRELRDRVKALESEKKALASELVEARKGLEEIHKELQS